MRLLSQLARVANRAKLVRGWQIAFLGSEALGLKAGQAMSFLYDTSALVTTFFLLAAEWHHLTGEQLLELGSGNFVLFFLL